MVQIAKHWNLARYASKALEAVFLIMTAWTHHCAVAAVRFLIAALARRITSRMKAKEDGCEKELLYNEERDGGRAPIYTARPDPLWA